MLKLTKNSSTQFFLGGEDEDGDAAGDGGGDVDGDGDGDGVGVGGVVVICFEYFRFLSFATYPLLGFL